MLRHVLRWRFETPQMEAEFQAQMAEFVGKTVNVWCLLLFLFFAVLEGLWFMMPRTTFVVTLPYVIVLLLLLCLFLLTNLVPGTRRYISTVLPLVCTAIFALVGWAAHRSVAQSTRNALDLALVRTGALLEGQPEAQAELAGYVRDQLSRKVWYIMMLIMFVSVDALRLTGGTTHNAFYVHVMPLVVIIVTTFCSDQVSRHSIDVISIAVLFAVYAAVSSVHMLMTFRDRFHVDYQLRQRLEKETEMMEVAKNVEVAQRQASQKADSMLNHILKNILADAHGCIDLFFGQRDNVGEAEGHLRRAQESLERGMRWCKKRQVMVQVHSGDYTPILAPVSLRKLVDGVMYGRDIVVDIPDVTVYIDSLLCEVVLDNAISNAFRHGDGALGPVSLVIITDLGKDRSLRLTFSLTNYVSRAQALSAEFVAQLTAGGDVAGLTCTPALSGHLGLRHMFMAAAAHGMAASLEQVGDLVVFAAELEVDTDDGVEHPPSSPSLASLAAAPFPPGVCILCLDDSDIARRVLLHGLTSHVPQAVSCAYGATREEVAAFETAALAGADLLILDQHLEYPHVTLYGTDTAQRLRRAGYPGVICVRSANATPEDEALYRRCGADCMIGKDVPLRDMVTTLQLAFHHHAQLPPTAPAATPPKVIGTPPPLSTP
eukprot:EG_transcript_3560